jgi:tyrosine-protein phosphatase SIW14
MSKIVTGRFSFHTASITALSVLICLATLSVAQKINDAKLKGVPNFHQVNATLFRGGQPEKGALLRLKEIGVKTIINLRDDDERARDEAVEAQAGGLRYFNIPFARFDRPSDKEIDDVMKVINSPDNQPIFIHCKRGADRTGTVIAIFRIEHDGWTSEQAKAEANHYGLGFWQVKMKDYIRDYYDRKTDRDREAASQSQKPRE